MESERASPGPAVDVDSLILHGELALSLSRHGEAQRFFLAAIAGGAAECWSDLGAVLMRQRSFAEAVAAFELAVQARQPDWWPLGRCRELIGDRDGATRAFRTGAAGDDPHCQIELALRLVRAGEPAPAAVWARRAGDWGLSEGEVLAALCRAEDLAGRALAGGRQAAVDPVWSERAFVALMAASDGWLAQAWALFDAAWAGDAEAWGPLGDVLADLLRDRDAALVAFDLGVEAGDPGCHVGRGDLLVQLGKLADAEREYRAGAAAGDPAASAALRWLLFGDEPD